MKTGFAKGIAALATCGAAAVGIALFACSSSSSGGSSPTVDAAGIDFCAPQCSSSMACPAGQVCTTNGTCAPDPGTFPNSECESSDTTGCMMSSTCTIDQATCGSITTCLPMANNTGKTTQDFRLRRLTVASPVALSKAFIQKGVLDQGISLHANGTVINDAGPPTPSCGENGDGSFNWLVRLDTVGKTVTTGGAPPSTDPFKLGYCFATGTYNNIAVTPIVIPYTTNADTTLAAGPVDNLNVPIYVHGDLNNVVVLPLHNASFSEVKVSTDGNCIGSFNYGALDSQCTDVRENCSKWHTDGALGGYITLAEADQVAVQDLNSTLCVLLTSSNGVMPTTGGVSCGANPCLACKRDASGNIDFQGDYCSTTKSAATSTCADSFWLSATFAAAAITINDGSGVAQCMGGTPSPDAGTPVDAATPPADASAD